MSSSLGLGGVWIARLNSMTPERIKELYDADPETVAAFLFPANEFDKACRQMAGEHNALEHSCFGADSATVLDMVCRCFGLELTPVQRLAMQMLMWDGREMGVNQGKREIIDEMMGTALRGMAQNLDGLDIPEPMKEQIRQFVQPEVPPDKKH